MTVDIDSANPPVLHWIVRGERWGRQPYEDLWLGVIGLFVKDARRLSREVSADEAEQLRSIGVEIFTLQVTNHTQETRVGLFRDEDHLTSFARTTMRAEIERFEL